MTCFITLIVFLIVFPRSSSLPHPSDDGQFWGFMKSGFVANETQRRFGAGAATCPAWWPSSAGSLGSGWRPRLRVQRLYSKDGLALTSQTPEMRPSGSVKRKVAPCAGCPSVASPGRPLPQFLHFKILFPLRSPDFFLCFPSAKGPWVFCFVLFFKVWLGFRLSDQ